MDGVDAVLQPALLFEQRVHLVVGELFREARGDRFEVREQIADAGEAFLDVAEHVLVGVELGLLREEADLDAVGGPRFAEEVLVDAGEDAQQRALAGAVGTHDADLGAGQEGQRDAVEQDAVGADHLAEVAQREDEFGHGASPSRTTRFDGKGAV